MVDVRSVPPGTSVATNALVTGEAWAGPLTYGFAPDAPAHLAVTTAGARPATAGLKAAVRDALAQVQAFTGLVVERRADGARSDLRVVAAEGLAPDGTDASLSLGAYGFGPGEGDLAGDMFFGPSVTADLSRGSYGFRAVLHEVGHALGLKHPHEPGRFAALPAHLDGPEASVMSARSTPGGALRDGLGIERGGYSHTYMPADIAALQHLYGANYSDARNSRYVFDPDEHVMLETIWDGGGTDTYDFSRYDADLGIDLAPGGYSTTGQEPQLNRAQEIARGDDPVYAMGAVHNALLFEGSTRSIIENALGGTGDDTIFGNQVANRLRGGAGDDRLAGGGRGDALRGGPGDDALGGGAGDDALGGGTGRDVLRGGAGSDSLRGGPGDDRARGGAGDDTIRMGPGDDRGHGGDGDDRLRGQLGDDRLEGEAGSDRLFGGRGNDILAGGPGDDMLDGGRASRAGDRLTGGGGADVFVLSDTATVVDFDPAEGDMLDVPDPQAAFASLADAGGGATLTLGGGETVLLRGVTAGDLDLTAFI